ncbi:MAG: hypothetical protein RL630_396 [Verrucomicrobiota bacterium]|jgi:hypothetical protein
MEILKTLAVALSLGTLAGLNLYLTVFVTGLAVRMDWVVLPAPLHGLEVLAHPVVLAVAGVLFLIEFLADKIPWIDTAWDAVHTFIRPVGAAALAVAAIGDAHPVFEIVGVLLAGGMAFSAHAAKAGTRVLVNASPEPFSNIGLSLAEDGLVLGGLALVAWNPLLALFCSVISVATVLWFLPKIVRGVRAILWLAWMKLQSPPDSEKTAAPLEKLPERWDTLLRQMSASKSAIEWTLPCISRRGDKLPANLSGWIVSLAEQPAEIYFLGRTWHGGILAALDIQGATVEFHDGFLASRIEIRHREGKPNQAFFFNASLSKSAQEAASRLIDDARLASRTPGLVPTLT